MQPSTIHKNSCVYHLILCVCHTVPIYRRTTHNTQILYTKRLKRFVPLINTDFSDTVSIIYILLRGWAFCPSPSKQPISFVIISRRSKKYATNTETIPILIEMQSVLAKQLYCNFPCSQTNKLHFPLLLINTILFNSCLSCLSQWLGAFSILMLVVSGSS